MTKMFCYVGDLLGFRNINLRLRQRGQTERVSQLTQLVESGKDRFNIENCKLLSDTIFAGVGASAESLKNLLDFSKYLLEKGLENALPVRGAIAFGDATWGSVVHGKAIINAYEHAEKQNWIGASCTKWKGPALGMLNELWDLNTDFNTVFVYPIPMKDGRYTYLPAVSWEVPSFRDLRRNTVTKGLVTKKYMNWDYANKIQNTILFSFYLNGIKNGIISSKHPSVYVGDLIISDVDSLIDEYIEDMRLLRSGYTLHMEPDGRKVFEQNRIRGKKR